MNPLLPKNWTEKVKMGEAVSGESHGSEGNSLKCMRDTTGEVTEEREI